MSLYDTLADEFSRVIADAKAKAADGISLRDVTAIFLDVVGTFIRIAAQTKDVDGATKREAVVVACETFYREVIAPIDLPYIPNIIEGMIDRQIEAAIRPVVEGMIDGVYRLLKDSGQV